MSQSNLATPHMRPDQRVKAMFLQDILQEQLQRRQAAALREKGKGQEEEEDRHSGFAWTNKPNWTNFAVQISTSRYIFMV